MIQQDSPSGRARSGRCFDSEFHVTWRRQEGGGGGTGEKKTNTHTKKTQKGPASMAYATKGYGSVDVAIAKESDGIRASVSVLGAWT